MTSASPAPAWARDLVIYEVNPRAFTSPAGAGDGSGSGTFASLPERLDYLEALGVNAIWLAGYSLATEHFYGIWSVYAAADPTQFDPRLGSADDFRNLVEQAHRRGIRVLLDVIAHGLLDESLIVARHPEWFSGGSWGMSDYDYAHPGFRAWWKKTWIDYALDYDIDGFRIDVSMVDPTLWEEIAAELAAAGKEVVVFGELERLHFCQTDNWFPQVDPCRELHFRETVNGTIGLQSVQISSHDNGWLSFPGDHYATHGSRARMAHGGLLSPRVPIFFSGEEFAAVPRPLPNLTQELFGGGEQGGWLYGNRLDWAQLDEPFHADFLDDCQQMLATRGRFRRLLHGDPSALAFASVPADGASQFVPFAVGDPGAESLIVLTNDTRYPVSVRFRVPRAELGYDASDLLVATDAVDGTAIPLERDVGVVEIGPDFTRGGGYRVVHVSTRG